MPLAPWEEPVVVAEALASLAVQQPAPKRLVLSVDGALPAPLQQVVQAMAGEAGIRISIEAKEFATLLADQTAGAYQASQVGWSGRVDPDGNIHQFLTTGGGINDSGYSNAEVDALLNGARVSNDTADRRAAYYAAADILMQDLPIVYLYHPVWIWAMEAGIEGFTAYPDGMIRLAGVTLTE